MSFVNDLLGRLFPKQEREETGDDSGYRPPFLAEKLERSPSFEQDFLLWQTGDEVTRILQVVEKAYDLKKEGISVQPETFLFKSEASNGFYFTPSDDIPSAHFPFLLDLFRDRVLELEYRLYSSDRLVKELPDHIQTTERHYLKPISDREHGQMANQRFGNVLMEYVMVDDQPSYVKVMAHTYSDSKFDHPLPFDVLKAHLFKT